MPTTAASTASDVLCSLSLAPSGHLVFRSGGAAGHPLPSRTVERIEAAFSHGPGHGLLLLGLDELGGELGPLLGYWRDAARLLITKLRGFLDLDEAIASGLKVPLEADEAASLLAAAPPMPGLEYLSEDALRSAWNETAEAFSAEVRSSGGGAEAFFKGRNAVWSAVGRVFFHLAENKARPDLPFAFLATYTSRVSSHGKLQHVPLGRAVKEQAAAANRNGLLSLLVPVQKAAAESPFLKEMVDSGRVFQPQAWTPHEAHQFLRETPLYESKGIFVRVPNWWNPRSPPRVRVGVTVGRGQAAGLGADALLDFSVQASLEGEPLSEEEWREILDREGGLALVKGRWVEVDREKLAELLRHWKSVEKAARRGGVSFLEGMRLLSRLPLEGASSSETEAAAASPASEWLTVEAGEWLRGILEELRSPTSRGAELSPEELRAALRPYQAEGVKWLWLLHKLRLGACLADDMGLGKTLQVIGLLLLMKRERSKGDRPRPSLVVLPASLIGNWKSECARFAPGLKVLVAHPSEQGCDVRSAPVGLAAVDLVVTTYSMVYRLEWLKETEWSLVVLDEAQAIKNPGARQTQAVKTLKGLHRLALTGTPVENRLEDLWSLFDFLSPGLLGGLKQFSRLARAGEGDSREAYGRIRSLVRPYLLRRLKTDKRIIADLPDKQDVKVFCGLRKKQAVHYQQAVRELEERLGQAEGMQRRGTILAFLMRFKQICNHPSQWTGDGAYDPGDSGKTARLAELCDEIASRQEKALVFTQFREITGMLATLLERVFGRRGLILDGDTPVKERGRLVEEFQLEGGPPFFVLSLKAGGTGLNLTAASHVVHFDRWWNPAVENQATDRAYRIGQKRNVLVHKFVCTGTVEEKIDALLESKQRLSDEVLKDGAEATLTEMSNEELLRFVSMDASRALAEP